MCTIMSNVSLVELVSCKRCTCRREAIPRVADDWNEPPVRIRHARVEFARLSRRRYPYLIGVIPRGYISRRFLSNMSLRVVTRCQLPLRCSVSSRHPHPLPRLQPLRDLFSSPTSLSCYVSHLPYLDQFSVSTLLRRALADQHTLSRIQVSLPELGPWKHACLWRLDNHRKDGTRSLRR